MLELEECGFLSCERKSLCNSQILYNKGSFFRYLSDISIIFSNKANLIPLITLVNSSQLYFVFCDWVSGFLVFGLLLGILVMV